MVNTTNVNAQSDINLRTDLTGEVRVVFCCDFLPLGRFADSAAIQLINSHAIVPTHAPPPNGAAPAADGTAPAPAPAHQHRRPRRSHSPRRDPWSPRS